MLSLKNTECRPWVASTSETSLAEHMKDCLDDEKELVLLFLDIRNFTAFVESHQRPEVFQVIRSLFTTLDQIIVSHNGVIIETGGDSIYAIFGLDDVKPDSVQMAVESGFSILSKIKKLNSTFFRQQFHQTIEVGIGLHVGRVIVGNLKLKTIDHLMVMGAPVIIASRLESATKQLNNNFIISDEIFDRLLSYPEKSIAVTIALKGLKEPFHAHLIGEPFKCNYFNK